MAGLRPWEELPIGGSVQPDPALLPRTGGWRTGLRPQVDLDGCVNCLLCWVYCPDSAIRVVDGAFAGFDLDLCKGCEICAAVCPAETIAMVADDG